MHATTPPRPGAEIPELFAGVGALYDVSDRHPVQMTADVGPDLPLFGDTDRGLLPWYGPGLPTATYWFEAAMQQRATLSGAQAQDFQASGDLTLSLWVYRAAEAVGPILTLGGTGQPGWALWSTPDGFELRVQDGAAHAAVRVEEPARQLRHLVAEIDRGRGQLRLRLDGGRPAVGALQGIGDLTSRDDLHLAFDGQRYGDVAVGQLAVWHTLLPDDRLARLFSLGEGRPVAYALAEEAGGVPPAQQVNWTGDPVGGGPGYSRIIPRAQADHAVSSVRDLVDWMDTYEAWDGRQWVLRRGGHPAAAGEVVFVAADLDITGYRNLNPGGGVTLASNRGEVLAAGRFAPGARLWSTDFYFDIPHGGATPFLIDVQNQRCRITGLIVEGPNPYHLANIAYIHEEHGISAGIRTGPKVEIDNVEVRFCDKYAVQHAHPQGCWLHHSYLHDTCLEGYGYGVWHGGSGRADAGIAAVEACHLDRHKHYTDAASRQFDVLYRYNAYFEARYQNQVNHHGNKQGEIPGGRWWLRNIWYAPHERWRNNSAIEDPPLFGGGRPGPGQTWYVRHQYFLRVRDFETLDPWGMQKRRGLSDRPDSGDDRYVFGENHYGAVAGLLPEIDVRASKTAGNAPLGVVFEADQPGDAGRRIVEYRWHFADGRHQYDLAAMAFGPRAEKMFTEIGTYPVRLWVKDEHGLVNYTSVDVRVLPVEQDRLWLSMWVMADLLTERSGYIKKGVWVDDEEVWSEDVAGTPGYRHVVVDLTPYTAGRRAFQLMFGYEVIRPTRGDPAAPAGGVRLYVDQIELFGAETSLERGDFKIDFDAGDTDPHRAFRMYRGRNRAQPKVTRNHPRSGFVDERDVQFFLDHGRRTYAQPQRHGFEQEVRVF
jgi:hypothetical protein